MNMYVLKSVMAFFITISNCDTADNLFDNLIF